MKLKISRGGQISLPAAIRHRWATENLVIEDLGDRVVIRPMPKDPIRAARGSLPSRGHTANRDRAQIRREESASPARRGR